jgi:uncharacterized membrane protein
MKNIKSSKLILIFLFVIFLGLMLYSYFTLPVKVAIHFSGDGTPNGWMDKIYYVLSFGLLGILLPLFVIWIFHITPNLPKGLINLPNKEYWLAPEQFQQTKSDINVYGIWFANILLFILLSGGCIILDANMHSVVHSIPTQYTLWLILLPLIWFIWKFLRRFKKPS